MQLNICKGKSSVIVPIVAAALANGSRLMRIIMARPQSKQIEHTLTRVLGGLRDSSILLAQPEHLLSLRLSGLEAALLLHSGQMLPPAHLEKKETPNETTSDETTPDKTTPDKTTFDETTNATEPRNLRHVVSKAEEVIGFVANTTRRILRKTIKARHEGECSLLGSFFS